jgi:hypothetical protein
VGSIGAKLGLVFGVITVNRIEQANRAHLHQIVIMALDDLAIVTGYFMDQIHVLPQDFRFGILGYHCGTRCFHAY